MGFRRKITRRQFIKGAAIAGAGMALPMKFGVRSAQAFYQSSSAIPLFGTTLRGVGPGGIPVAAPDAFPAPVTGVTHYTMDINQFTDAGVLPAGYGASTTLWGYNPAIPLGGGTQPQKHLGGIIVGQKGTPIQLTFRNNLPATHIIPNDITIMGANLGANRTAVHFHGGLVPWISDGGPFDWWNPAGGKGASFLNNQVLNPGAALNEAEYYYPLNQSARFGWYHDHAFGITRINAYAGIASALLIRDVFEINLKNQGLPEFIENSVLGGTPIKELPLVIQDKIFVDNLTLGLDPTWTGLTASGSLWYPHTYERNRWRLSGNAGATGSLKNLALPDPSVIPEMFGDTMLVNGTAFPEVPVEARRYRLRFLNACNARFLNLQFYIGDGSANGITLNPVTGVPTNAPALIDPNAPGASATLLQIGTEGGFLPKPVKIPTNVPFNPVTFGGSLVVAPAERPDLLVDFSGVAPGQTVVLYNDAAAPFPVGDPRNDYFPGWNLKGNPVNGLGAPGFGPNSRVLMRFKVGAATGAADTALTITTASDLSTGLDTPLIPFGVSTPPPGVAVRPLTLNESFDAYGRLIQMLGTNVPLGSPSAGFGRAYTDPATEMPLAGTTEVWEIYNLTADVHPMHFHLVNVQVINRQVFQNYNGTPTFKALPTPPAPNETGWKETVPMYPGTVTRIIMKFDLASAAIKTATGATIPTPSSPRTGGAEYVWHCHILEHEEHDMMRPMVVI